MDNLILTPQALAERRVKRGDGLRSGLYYGTQNEADVYSRDTEEPVRKRNGQALESIVVAKGAQWVNSEEYWKLWNEVAVIQKKLKANWKRGMSQPVNINQFPDDYYDLVDRIRIDLTRRRIEQMDFTSEIANEIINPAFGRSIRIDEFLPFAGAFHEVKGTGDSVPLIQQKTGETGTVTNHIFGLGWERSLEDELYNLDIFTLQKVNDAVARAYRNLRNHRNGIGDAIDYTIAGAWPLAQRVAPSQMLDINGNVMYDISLYYTLRNALRKLKALTDPQTTQEIATPRIVLLCRDNNTNWDIGRIIRGQLDTFGSSGGSRMSLASLPIDEIWQYNGDVLYIGEDMITYQGVPDGHAYLFVPGSAGAPNYVLTKRGVTQEVGRGDVLSLSREKRAFYTVQTEYQSEWFGEVAGGAAGTGFIVDIELPTFDENT